MNKETNELRKLTKEKLLGEKKATEKLLLGCHKGVKPLVPVEKKKTLMKRIARINTLLREREK